ncbi:MAG: aminoacyl-tRNA hydrolase [Planctomycetes bacterium]|nr:aminoacyl-tRNA hydrolase [Planctomycetota bacterium]
MKLIVGLGNPGSQYERTRHNAGFIAVDRLIARHAAREIVRSKFGAAVVETRLPFNCAAGMPGAAPSSPDDRCLFMKPLSYMNRSGQSVAEAVRFYKLSPTHDLFVLVDDIALPCGAVRVRADGGAGGHNGLSDIERCLGTAAYPRCRIGVDAPGIIPQADYVLGKFTEAQWAAADPALNKAADAADLWLKKGINAAMNSVNAPPPRPKPPRRDPGTEDPAGTDAPKQRGAEAA